MLCSSSLRSLLASLALLAFASGAAGAEGANEAVLAFAHNGEVLRRLDLGQMRSACPAQRVEVEDPYYARPMTFSALPLRCVLELGFGQTMEELSAEDFSLRALDGYTRPSTGAQLGAAGGYLAFADAALADQSDRAGETDEKGAARFLPIARRQVDPAPFYMIWSGEGQNDPHIHPWPYQLATIERVPFERRHPHTVPSAAAKGSPARAGYAIFRASCIMCHSINDEGGKVGPELNIPRSIVEYRPADQIKAYVRDPASFRYTTMPAHPNLGDDDLDALVAYFRAMSELKHDPRRKSPAK